MSAASAPHCRGRTCALALLLLTLGGASCARPRVPASSPPAVPEAFEGVTGAGVQPSLGDLPWWRLFQDPVLLALLEEAVAHNDDVAVAAARVAEARALLGVTAAQARPQVDATADAERERGARTLSDGGGDARTTLSLGASISWEIDLWGRVRWASRAARARSQVLEETRLDVLRVLVADVAEAYLRLRGLDEEARVVEETTTARDHTVELFSSRAEGGTTSRLEVVRAVAERALAAAALPEVDLARAETEHRISLLLGRPPGPVARGGGDVVPLAPPVPPGVPAELLRRRPDLRAAEAAVVAAAAEVGVARADLLPRLSLAGFLGLEGRHPADLPSADGIAASVAANLLGPLYDGGRRRATVAASQAAWCAAVAAHGRAVRIALREVADALAAVRALGRAREAHQARVEALVEAVTLTASRYEGHVANYLEVLDAQRDLFAARLVLTRTHRDLQVSLVRLYRALGGGWTEAARARAT